VLKEQFNLLLANGVHTPINAETDEDEYWVNDHPKVCYVDGVWVPGWFTRAELMVRLARDPKYDSLNSGARKEWSGEPGESSEPADKKPGESSEPADKKPRTE